jgi:hypothetical protein
VYRLIELVAYYYQKVASVVLEATTEGMKKLSVLRGWSSVRMGDRPGSEDNKYVI